MSALRLAALTVALAACAGCSSQARDGDGGSAGDGGAGDVASGDGGAAGAEAAGCQKQGGDPQGYCASRPPLYTCPEAVLNQPPLGCTCQDAFPVLDYVFCCCANP